MTDEQAAYIHLNNLQVIASWVARDIVPTSNQNPRKSAYSPNCTDSGIVLDSNNYAWLPTASDLDAHCEQMGDK